MYIFSYYPYNKEVLKPKKTLDPFLSKAKRCSLPTAHCDKAKLDRSIEKAHLVLTLGRQRICTPWAQWGGRSAGELRGLPPGGKPRLFEQKNEDGKEHNI